MPGEALAPERGGGAVPAVGEFFEVRAAWSVGEGADDGAGGFEAFLHALDAYGGVLRGEFHRLGDVGSAELSGRLQPPQGQQGAVVLVHPAGGLGHLGPLPGQAQVQDREVDEVGARVGVRLVRAAAVVDGLAGGACGPDGAPVVAYPIGGDGDEPGPEPLRFAQRFEVGERADEGVLDDVVDVGVPAAQGASGDVVDQGQVVGDQAVPCPGVAPLGIADQGGRAVVGLGHDGFAFGAGTCGTAGRGGGPGSRCTGPGAEGP
ncbi:hypothetical protein ADK51_20045 [Streptomyces sp. WM6368]|nr:hypothetical protein ADK51_20045 [Streptomyces sp. WM6368]